MLKTDTTLQPVPALQNCLAARPGTDTLAVLAGGHQAVLLQLSDAASATLDSGSDGGSHAASREGGSSASGSLRAHAVMRLGFGADNGVCCAAWDASGTWLAIGTAQQLHLFRSGSSGGDVTPVGCTQLRFTPKVGVCEMPRGSTAACQEASNREHTLNSADLRDSASCRTLLCQQEQQMGRWCWQLGAPSALQSLRLSRRCATPSRTLQTLSYIIADATRVHAEHVPELPLQNIPDDILVVCSRPRQQVAAASLRTGSCAGCAPWQGGCQCVQQHSGAEVTAAAAAPPVSRLRAWTAACSSGTCGTLSSAPCTRN